MPSTIRIAFFVALQIAVGFADCIQAEDRQWYRMSPDSSIIVRIAVDPATPQTIYAIGRPVNSTNRLYKSTNGGNSWIQIKTNLYDAPLVINHKSAQIIFAGPDRSIDGGDSWSRFSGADWNPTILAIDSQNPQTIYAASASYSINGMYQSPGVFRSTNGGSDWIKVLAMNVEFCSLTIDPLSSQTVYAGTAFTLYKSTNSGENWSQANTGLPTTRINSLAIDPQNPQTIYAGTSRWNTGTSLPNPGIWRSTNGGFSWNAIDNGLGGSAVGSIVIDPMTPQTIYAAAEGVQNGVFKSTDGGDSWTKVTEGDENANVLAISPSMPQTIYASISQFGLQKSMNWGKSWTPINNGLPSVNVATISINPANHQILYAGDALSGWLSQSTNGGRSWERFYTPLNWGAAILADPKSVQTLYGSDYTFLFKSMDGGTNWATIASSGGAVLLRDPKDSQTIYASMKPSQESHLFKSTDDGNTWKDLTKNATILAIDPASTDILYTANPLLLEFSKSTNGGNNWSDLSAGLPQCGIYSIAIDPATHAAYIATRDYGVFKSIDGGKTWSSINNEYGATSLAIDPGNPNVIYVATDDGRKILKTSNEGASWSNITPTLPVNTIFSHLAMDPSPEHILYAVGNGGVWAYSAKPLDITVEMIAPHTATVGGPSLTLAVNGNGFGPDAVVLWNGSALATTYINQSQLMADVPANLITAAGLIDISVSSEGNTSANFGFAIRPLSLSINGDFNGDGRPDILWRNSSTGENYVWYADGVMVLGGGNLPMVADQNWKVAGVADFNNDNRPDVLWRNAATGDNYVWYLEGVTVLGGGNLPMVADQNWKVVGVADFNNNNKPDVLWRNAATGDNYVWYLEGVTVLGGGNLPMVADQNWKLVGVADFNLDGNPDILWRNAATGDNYVWYLDGVTVLGGGSLPMVADQNWKLVGVADFNLDSKPDILWRNASTGENYIWYLDGVTVLGGGSLPAVTDQNWTIVPQGSY